MKRRIPDPADLRRVAEPMLGSWSGQGHGEYPTVETFFYREELDVSARDGDSALRYEQRTWRISGDTEVPSHWEVGIMAIDEDGRLLVTSAQNGRTEALRGEAYEDEAGLELRMEAVEFGVDRRLAAARRVWRLRDATLSYDMSMATARVPALTFHLRNELRRVQPPRR